ncbi:hypothetical protein ACO0QE_003913 [Hanseniaspora vineae]
MFRDRTNLYVSYRRTYPKAFRTTTATRSGLSNAKEFDEEEGFPMLDSVDVSNEYTQENNSLKLIIDNILKPIDMKLSSLDTLIDDDLVKLYKKVMLPGFQDRTEDINKIEKLNYQIIKYLQICSSSIQLIKESQQQQQQQQHGQDNSPIRTAGIDIILENLGKAYARKIQARSTKFRKLQNNYLKFLNKDDFKPLPSSSVTQQESNPQDLLLLEEGEEVVEDDAEYSKSVLVQQKQQRSQQMKSEYLKKRDEEITELAQGVLEVSTIFKELQELIVDQGSVIDRIDYNIEMTSTNLQQAQKELVTATKYQKREGKCKIILFLVLLCILMFFIFMLKPSGGGTKTVVIEKPATPNTL